MKLPNAEKAIIVEPKITRYLLDLSSENGKSKARFFLSFGFTINEWNVLADTLIEHAKTYELAKIEVHPPFGVHYIVEGILMTPDKRPAHVRVIWIIDEGDVILRFVSAYPL